MRLSDEKFKKIEIGFFKHFSLTRIILLIAVFIMIIAKFRSTPSHRIPLNIDLKHAGDVVVPDPDKIYPRTRESYELKYLKE